MSSEEVENKFACPPKQNIKLYDYVVKIEVIDNEYQDDNKHEQDEAEEDKEKSFTIRITYKKSTTNKIEFIDELVIRHKYKSFLLEVVRTLYYCFSKKAIDKGFIILNKDINSFSFAFESTDKSKSSPSIQSGQLLSCIRTCSLSRTKYTKQHAINKVKESNKNIHFQYRSKYESVDEQKQNQLNIYDANNTKPIIVECINAHHIHDPQWELEVTLNLSPGIYHLLFLCALCKDK